MTTPTPRTPVRLARGLKVNLDTALTAGDIKEGELVYAKDEDKLYIVEGGFFVAAGGGGGVAGIDDLSDVDTSTVAPTNGQVLTWDNVAGQWEPADTAASQIQGATDFKFNPLSGAPFYNSTGTPPFTAGEFQRESATITRVSPISSEGTNYSTQLQSHSGTIWFQANGGTVYSSTYLGWNSSSGGFGRITTTAAGDPSTFSTLQVFFSDPGTPPFSDPLLNGETLVWTDSESAFMPKALGADDLSDVDTSTVAPTDGQVLTWVAASSQWKPASLDGTDVRAALGIGEYADDTAAGTGGVASGAMYYNTTSSDYRLKT